MSDVTIFPDETVYAYRFERSFSKSRPTVGHVSHILARVAGSRSYETLCGRRIRSHETLIDATGRKPVCKACDKRAVRS